LFQKTLVKAQNNYMF